MVETYMKSKVFLYSLHALKYNKLIHIDNYTAYITHTYKIKYMEFICISWNAKQSA